MFTLSPLFLNCHFIVGFLELDVLHLDLLFLISLTVSCSFPIPSPCTVLFITFNFLEIDAVSSSNTPTLFFLFHVFPVNLKLELKSLVRIKFKQFWQEYILGDTD